MVKIGIMPYHNPIMITPDSRFANRRREMEIGLAISPIRLIGNKIGVGSNRLVKCLTPLFLMPW